MELYIHIPFCVRKCNYCDFLSFPVGRSHGEDFSEYVNALCRELGLRGGEKLETVYIGGGTPTLLSVSEFRQIFDTIYKHYTVSESAEITVECNPGTADYEKLCALRELSVNRLSIGLQSTCERELKLLGRIHNYEEFLQCFENARRAGFENISVDLMSAIPEQTMESYRSTINRILALNPEHISSYSLIIEEGTPFYNMELELPDEDTERKMYEITGEMLKNAGYERYEISNYSKEGFEGRHNSGYWTGVPYIGAGLGASSYIVNKEEHLRYSNIRDLKEYIKLLSETELTSIPAGLCENAESLSENDRMAEFMFLGLRMMKGIEVSEFEKRFGKNIAEVYGDVIEEHIRKGNLMSREGRIFLTESGIDICNSVMSDFIIC